ncbi:MAG: hypothetical protein EPN60_02970 [Nevskiaceae bacterium]|nr:MAG: hypothetical protein EPO48_00010 [Nevskiaceae bacterium]TAM32913.1 MAG: hypothetical protein EPN60_02970 [Nevskiaceae bacterium]
MSKPKLTALPATLFLVGLGLSLHYGNAWWRLPSYTEEDIAASVELNLAMDLQRGHATTPGGDRGELAALRGQLDQELRAEIKRERREVMQAFAGGIGALILSVAQMYWLRRRK